VYDDGGGDRLYATSIKYLGTPLQLSRNTVNRWDGDRWTTVGENTERCSQSEQVELFNYDDGGGESLWVGGWFTEINGILSNGIARLDCTRTDLGDAPEPPFPTLVDSDGARHVIGSGLVLGSDVSHEPDGKPSEHANADDFDDGVAFVSPFIPGLDSRIEVSASADAVLDGWIDFNADGDWEDPAERILDHRVVSAGVNTMVFEVPLSAVVGTVTVARFRLSSSGVDAPT
jgi:hypothetical protein